VFLFSKFRVETYSKEKVVLNLTNIEGDMASSNAVLRRP